MNLYEQIGEEKIDELVLYMYDDIIPNDDRINLLFNDGFEKIKEEQKLIQYLARQGFSLDKIFKKLKEYKENYK